MGQGKDLQPRTRRTKDQIGRDKKRQETEAAAEKVKAAAARKEAVQTFFQPRRRGAGSDAAAQQTASSTAQASTSTAHTSASDAPAAASDSQGPTTTSASGATTTTASGAAATTTTASGATTTTTTTASGARAAPAGNNTIDVSQDRPNVRCQVCAGVYDDTQYQGLIVGCEPDANEDLEGWLVMYRTVDGASKFLWRQGVVHGRDSGDGWFVRFDGDDPVDVELDVELYGDGLGKPEGSCWFRLVPKHLFADARRRIFRSAFTLFRRRCSRRKQRELGDGHCCFRAIYRQLLQQRGIDLGSSDPTPEHIYECRKTVAKGMRNHADHIVETTGGSFMTETESKASRKQAIFDAATTIELDLDACSTSCDSEHWFGGEHSTMCVFFSCEAN